MRKNLKRNFDISKYYPLFFTILFVVILFQYSFSSVEAIFYDLRVKYDFGISYVDNIVIVTMDEESDEFLGEIYPYTYASHERLLKKLLKDNPKVINYLVSLKGPQDTIEEEAQKNFKQTLKEYTSTGGRFRFGTDMDAWGEQLPPANLKDLGYSLALINVDNASFSRDDISRRAILNISGEDSLHLWTANEYRKTLGREPLDVKSIQGSYYLREADATFFLFRYYTSPLEKRGKIKKIPFHRVMVGNFPKGFFTDKIVLLGPSYLSNASDFVLTPFNKEEYISPKLNVHAQIIQALVQGKTILQLPRYITYILSILVAIFLSIIISKVQPTRGLFITLALMVGSIFLSYITFSFFGLWFYLTHLVLTIFVVYYIWVPFRAIGEYQRRYAIQEEAKLLKKVESLKQNFISLMSHDLKTPVAKIAGITDVLLQKHRENADLRSGLISIIDSTKELNRFITSILDLTKIESRNLTLNKVSKDVNTVISSVVEGLRYEAEENQIEFVTNLAPLYPIHLDVDLVKRVISNLVENAIKYSGPGSKVEISSWDDEKWVTVSIKDNGVGIDKENLEHIFDKFYRVKNDASHTIKGTGLGLYLVKYFVELHGGHISVNSEIGRGTAFKVMFPNQ